MASPRPMAVTRSSRKNGRVAGREAPSATPPVATAAATSPRRRPAAASAARMPRCSSLQPARRARAVRPAAVKTFRAASAGAGSRRCTARLCTAITATPATSGANPSLSGAAPACCDAPGSTRPAAARRRPATPPMARGRRGGGVVPMSFPAPAALEREQRASGIDAVAGGLGPPQPAPASPEGLSAAERDTGAEVVAGSVRRRRGSGMGVLGLDPLGPLEFQGS
jgi:hypothetical protein